MIHEDIRISSKRIIPCNCKHMDGSPPLYECLQQIILLDLTAPGLILIRGEDGTPHFVIRTVHKKGKKETRDLTALLINSIIKGKQYATKCKQHKKNGNSYSQVRSITETFAKPSSYQGF